VQLICNTKIQDNLYFNLNLENNGVRGNIDKFGVFTVMARGTLSQQHKYIGVFEQLFQLVRDPSAGNIWKITYTELRGRTK
jgi:hypothetical protein